jgi:NAD(P)-dependent dehydrogenase (short-subunit alcohol dehydrogenase family)
MELNNKVCLIAGASGAIGSAVAHRFQDEGARLALSSRSGDARNFSIRSDSSDTLSMALDVCNWDDVQRVVQNAVNRWGRLDVFVNCAGVIGPIGPLWQCDVSAWTKSVEVNLMGAFHLIRAVVPVMLRAGKGKIIHFSGGGAAYGRPYFTAYSAAKAALVRLTESLADELQDNHIDVNAIAPGPVKSRMWEELRGAGAAAGRKATEELRQMDANGGVSPDRAADLAVFLASDRSNGLTGRLISAVHDKWCEIEQCIPDRIPPDAWTLRRVPLK